MGWKCGDRNEGLALVSRWDLTLATLWTTGSKITTTRDGMPYVNKSKEARLKDARLLSLLRLLVMAT